MIKKILVGVSTLLGLFVVIGILGSTSSTNTNESNSIVVPVERQATTTPSVSTTTTSIPAITPSNTSTITDEVFYPVTKVVDGDTVAVTINGKSETIRLIGINTPETVDPRKEVECFGKEASNKAKELLTGKRVRIEKDATQGERDKYGRLLAYIYIENGVFFNKYMIQEGYAYEYTYNLAYKYQAEFKEAQKQAQANKKGLWATGACEQPTISTQPVSQPKPQAVVPTKSSTYMCSYNAYNCTDFKTEAEAQSAFESCGGTSNDIHQLDRDKDGKVCETLP